MKKKKDKIKLSIDEDITNVALNIPNKILEYFGKQATDTRIKAVEILDDLYKQIEREMIKHQEIKNEEYYILINHEELYDLYKANDFFVDIHTITNQGLYGDKRELLGIKVLVSGDVKKAELVRKV